MTITGSATHFSGASVVTFGNAAVTASAPTGSPTATSVTVNVSITAAAALGATSVTVTTGAEVVTLASGFTVGAPPTITQVNPNSGQQGAAALAVTITGSATHFSGASVVTFGNAAVTASAPTGSPTATSVTVNVSITAAAALGATSVTVTTGAEVVTLASGFTVIVGGVPAITQVSPNTGQQGSNLLLSITGQNTHWVQGTTLALFGSAITVQTLTINTATTATASISIAANAAPQAYSLTMNTGNEAPTLANAFTVTGAPVVTQVSPGSINQTQANLTVNITGAFTSWAQGTTNASFGAGITVNTLTINSPTTATATISSNNAATGLRTITMTTGVQVAALANGFGVTQAVAPPTVTITAPTDTSTVTSPTSVVGSVTSAILKSWTLAYKVSNGNSFLPLATGSSQVANAALGTLDPTLLLNGTYTIQLTATDLNNQTSTTQVTVVVGSNQKVGNFSVSFRDLTVPLPGFSIDVVRTYDTRNPNASDFGAGWSLSLKSITLSENRSPLGHDWQETQSGGFFPTYCVTESKAHIITFTFPDNTVYKFRPVVTSPSGGCELLFPIDGGTLAFTPLPGTNASITTTIDWCFGPASTGGPLWDCSLNEIDISSLQLKLANGSLFNVDINAGLTSAVDANGNSITFGAGGILHSSGKSVSFLRDGLGRITQITDPNGQALKYSYDLNGNLVSFSDRAGAVTTYTYNTTHGLLNINDPLGVQPLRNIYDNSGRLIQQIDSFGHVTNYTYSPAASTNIITDRLGEATVYQYDADGNITKETDALGDTVQRTFDAQDDLLTETDPLGHTSTNTYDTNRNLLSHIDPLGNTTTTTYNAKNQLLTQTDPLGRVLTNTFDANGNLTSTKNPLGNTTSFTINSQGVPTSLHDAAGGITAYGYDGAGNLTSETNPLGVVTTYSYDTNGNRLSKSVTRTTSSGPEVLLTKYQYDPNGRLIKTTNPDGSIVQTTYNGVGKPTATIDPLGRQTTYQYDTQNQLVQTTFPDGSSEFRSYDADGRVISAIDREGRLTTYTYDAVGRLTQTTYPDGTRTSTSYDAAGRATSKTDALGHTTTMTYDSAGRLTATTDALGHTATFAYDAVGNRTQITDANNKITLYQYDALNRPIKTTYPDGTSSSAVYDALGRVSSKTDQAGKATTFQYDSAGRLTRVVDALGQITQYAYDEVGNRISQTDASGRTTTFAYDEMGRLIKRTLPGLQSESFAYDLAGNKISHTDFNGKVTTNAYDLLNRLLAKTPDVRFGAPTVTFTYTLTGQRAMMSDASGSTTYTYDVRDRLLSKATPIGTLTYTYNAVGGLTSIRSSNAGGTSVSYAYDALNRLVSATDNNLSGSSSYTYDAIGNLATETNPNGVVTTYTYDTLNRLTNETIAKGGTLASYGYTLGAAGNRTAVNEQGGRSVSYAYDAIYRLTQETIAGAAANNGAISYTYDAVGNRLSRASTSAGVPTTSYTYDVDDRLTTDTYDANGNTTASGGHTYSYDFEDHLQNQDAGGVTIVYDGDGNRVAKTVGGVTTNYLVDDRNLTGFEQVLEEIRGGVVQRVYTYGLSLISQSQASGRSFYGHDGLGSVRLLTDTTGTVTDHYDYDAFGSTISQVGVTPNNYLFAGEQFDPDLGVYYNRARYYDQTKDRFRTMDSFEGGATDPLSLHKYLYAEANPVNGRDPSGQQFDLGSVAISIGIYATLGAIASVTFNGINNYALGLPFFKGAAGAAAFGAAALPLSIAFPAVGLALAGAGIYGAANTAWQVFNGNSTAGQQGAALFLVGISIFGFFGAAQNVSENGLWVNVGFLENGGLLGGNKQGPFSRGLADIQDRIADFSDVLQTKMPNQQGRITIGVGLAQDSSGQVHTLIGTSEPNGYIRAPMRPLIQPGDIVVKGTGHAEADIVAYAKAMGWDLIGVGATRPVCPACAAEIATTGAAVATPLK